MSRLSGDNKCLIGLNSLNFEHKSQSSHGLVVRVADFGPYQRRFESRTPQYGVHIPPVDKTTVVWHNPYWLQKTAKTCSKRKTAKTCSKRKTAKTCSKRKTAKTCSKIKTAKTCSKQKTAKTCSKRKTAKTCSKTKTAQTCSKAKTAFKFKLNETAKQNPFLLSFQLAVCFTTSMALKLSF